MNFAKMFSPEGLASMGDTAKRLAVVLTDIYKELRELNLNLKEYNMLHRDKN